MKHRLLASVFAALLILSTFAGCGLPGTGSNAQPTTDRPQDSDQVIQSVVINPSGLSGISTVPTEAPSDPTTIPTEAPTVPSSSTQIVTPSTTGTTKPSTNSTTGSTKPSTGSYVDPETCNHSYQQTSFEDSTCAKEGKKVSTCTKCGTTLTESISLKTSHTGGTATCKERAVCTLCGRTYGEYKPHSCAKPPFNCTVPTCCDTCGVVITAAKEHNFITYCEEYAICFDCCTQSDTIGPIGHTYSNGKCIRCSAKDPDYSGGGSGGSSSGSDTGSIIVKYSLTSYPLRINYGSVTGCTHAISGDDLILYVTMKRDASGNGQQALKAYYRISDGSMITVAKGEFSSSAIGPGSTVTVTVTIPDIIDSSADPYWVYISNYTIEY